MPTLAIKSQNKTTPLVNLPDLPLIASDTPIMLTESWIKDVQDKVTHDLTRIRQILLPSEEALLLKYHREKTLTRSEQDQMDVLWELIPLNVHRQDLKLPPKEVALMGQSTINVKFFLDLLDTLAFTETYYDHAPMLLDNQSLVLQP